MEKIISNLIILFCIFMVIFGIFFFIYFIYYYNISINIIKFLLGILILIIYLFIFMVLPYIINEKRTNLMNENFILDIFNKNSDTAHIRITDKNLLFEYKCVIRFAFIFPKFFIKLTLTHKEWYRTATFIIKNKNQLTLIEVNDIIKKINDLNNNEDGDIIINYNGNNKFVTQNDIDKIFLKYFKNKKDF